MSTNRLKTRNLFVLLLFLSAGTLGYLTYQSRRVVVRYERTYYQETEYRTGPAAYAARVVQWTDVDEFVDGYRKSRFVRRNIPIKVYYIEVRTELINRMPVEVPLQVPSGDVLRRSVGNLHARSLRYNLRCAAHSFTARRGYPVRAVGSVPGENRSPGSDVSGGTDALSVAG